MCFKETDILLPKFADNPDLMAKWGVIACDQYTSDRTYWNKVKETVGDNMSALNLIFPEIYLEIDTEEQKNNRITNIVENMRKYEKDLVCYKNSVFFIERKLKSGKKRFGIVGAVDLEEYDYKKDSRLKIRCTEETVTSRIPPRVKIRENALFELPHVMILYNDKDDTLMSNLRKNAGNFTKVYDFKLMRNSGGIKAFNLDKSNIDFVKNTLGTFEHDNLLFAVGDGNHSLATAKKCYENLKKTLIKEEYLNHPARYALAEIVNIYDESLEFEPIYRILFEVDPSDVIENMKKVYDVSENSPSGKNYQEFNVYYGETSKKIYVNNPQYYLPVKTVQIFLDDYIKKAGGRIDYVHGKSETMEFAKQKNSIGFIFSTMQKSELFPTIEKDGVLPRKTFSMGEADDKRFYIECRKIINNSTFADR